jgi:glucose/arabinose dehydrogenase
MGLNHRARRARPSAVRAALGASLLVVFTVVTSGCALAPPALAVTTVVSGLNHPWDVAFTPDGTMLFTERAGRIDALVDGQARVLAAPADVVAQNETGMLGLAVDPQFATTRQIYTCESSTLSSPADVRVVRWRVDASYTKLEDRADILTGITNNDGYHSGCRLRFDVNDPDHLFVGTGDAHIGTSAQDPQSLAGKVLRIDRDGKGASGNPGGTFRAEIYNYGHRNLQGLAFRPTDGQLYTVEHGPACDDELNKAVNGANYGWDPVGPTGVYILDEALNPMTDLAKFPTATKAVYSSGCPTVAPSGATFLTGSQWKAWDGRLAMTTLKGQTLFMVGFGDDDTVTSVDRVLTGYGRLRTAVEGPDGNLYLSTDADAGAILKVTPS